MKHIFIVMFCLSICGCTHLSRFDSTDDEVITTLNRKGRWRLLRAYFHDGSRVKVTRVRVDGNCISWLNKKTNIVEGYHLSEVRNVKYRNHGLGLIEGAGIGILSGAAVGASYWALDGEDSEYYSKHDGTYLWGIFGGVAGGATIGTMGMLVGANMVFEPDSVFYQNLDFSEDECEIDSDEDQEN